MDQKKTATRPDCNQMQPDHWLELHAFQNKKLPKTECNQTGCNWLQLVLGTSQKFTHFEPILKRNGPEMHEIWPK